MPAAQTTASSGTSQRWFRTNKHAPGIVDLDETVDFEAREREDAGERHQDLCRRHQVDVEVPERAAGPAGRTVLQHRREEREAG